METVRLIIDFNVAKKRRMTYVTGVKSQETSSIGIVPIAPLLALNSGLLHPAGNHYLPHSTAPITHRKPSILITCPLPGPPCSIIIICFRMNVPSWPIVPTPYTASANILSCIGIFESP